MSSLTNSIDWLDFPLEKSLQNPAKNSTINHDRCYYAFSEDAARGATFVSQNNRQN